VRASGSARAPPPPPLVVVLSTGSRDARGLLLLLLLLLLPRVPPATAAGRGDEADGDDAGWRPRPAVAVATDRGEPGSAAAPLSSAKLVRTPRKCGLVSMGRRAVAGPHGVGDGERSLLELALVGDM
jgi:hypothetical protein